MPVRKLKNVVTNNPFGNLLARVGLINHSFYDSNLQFPSIIESSDIVPVHLTRQFPGQNSSIGKITASNDTNYACGILDYTNVPDSWLWQPGGNGVNHWIKVKLPSAKRLGAFILRSKSDSCPTQVKVEGSNDDDTWFEVFNSSDLGVWGATYESKVFAIDGGSTDEFLYYKLTILASSASILTLTLLRFLRPASEVERTGMIINASKSTPLTACFATKPIPVIGSLESPLKLTRQNLIDAAINQDTADALNAVTPTSTLPLGVFLERNTQTGDLSVKVALLWYYGYGQGVQISSYPTSGGIPFTDANPSIVGAWKCTAYTAGSTIRPARQAFDGDDGTSAQISWNGYIMLSRADNRAFYVKDVYYAWAVYGGYSSRLEGIRPDGTGITFRDTPSSGQGVYTKNNMSGFVPGWYIGLRVWGTDGCYVKTLMPYTITSPIRSKVDNGEIYYMFDDTGTWVKRQLIPIGKIIVSSTDIVPVSTPNLGMSLDTFGGYYQQSLI